MFLVWYISDVSNVRKLETIGKSTLGRRGVDLPFVILMPGNFMTRTV